MASASPCHSQVLSTDACLGSRGGLDAALVCNATPRYASYSGDASMRFPTCRLPVAPAAVPAAPLRAAPQRLPLVPSLGPAAAAPPPPPGLEPVQVAPWAAPAHVSLAAPPAAPQVGTSANPKELEGESVELNSSRASTADTEEAPALLGAPGLAPLTVPTPTGQGVVIDLSSCLLEQGFQEGQTFKPYVANEFPSVGSVGHSAGWCKPCAFIFKEGCNDGAECKFCHLCEPGTKKLRKKAKKAIRRAFATVDQTF
uniref:C3H1-type domain-containing protein n=1 Tax=Zooxanthella nutricula TaxID=1333877 RepID=A0A6U6NB54_9DINO|mmetsp:Transcript_47328/g.143917  ORF Transcript_47328/g.143917 Transcript_47328/m.143917 type:complete len:256 (+) Transcript_47328:91-858(+)